MDAWRNHMPEGMLLKSDGFASNLYDPQGEYPLSRYCRELGIAYDDKGIRVRLDTFCIPRGSPLMARIHSRSPFTQT